MSDRQKVLDKAVLGLFQEYASTFLTTLYCSLKFSWDDKIPTACTNGIVLKINFDWFTSLSEKMRVTLLAHELWHVAYMHMMRLGERDPKIWNMAADYAINGMLEDNGYTFDLIPGTHRNMGLIDHEYDGMSAEQIYEELIKDAIQVDLPFGEDFSADGLPVDGEADQPLTADETATVIANITRAATLSQMNANEAGKLPGDFTELIDGLLNPKLPWTSLLSRWLTERSSRGYTWRKPNRRYQHAYLPSRGGQSGLAHLMWALDVSGSVNSEQLRIFVSELKGAKEAHSPERTTVVTFDTRIQNTWEFSDSDEIAGLHISGRGGTDMTPVFEMAKELRPAALIMFSDMYCSIPDPIPGIPVLWLCYDNSSWSPPYGDVIHVCSSPSIAA